MYESLRRTAPAGRSRSVAGARIGGRAVVGGLAALAAATLACAMTTVVAAGAATATPGAAAPIVRAAGVVPVSGDRFAPAGTGITFLGVRPTALAGLRVVGSLSGLHAGTVRPLVGASGSVFTPDRAFAGGEQVTVSAPGLLVPGAAGGVYSFRTAVPAPHALAVAALREAAALDAPASQAKVAASPRQFTPPTCPTVVYHTAPKLFAQEVCMNVGVTTSGTTPGTYLFVTPGNIGSGIYSDTGQLVWWHSAAQNELDETVVQFGGSPYLAMWDGSSVTGYGDGAVTLLNEHYQVAGEVTSGNAFAGSDVDLHEFQVTGGGDALVGIYDPVQETINGTSQTVLQYVVQKVSLVQSATGIHTGSVLFEWDSLTDVPTSASTSGNPGPGTPWDYFHGNAISLDSDGNIIVSSRNTWGIYKVDDTAGDAHFGHVIWQVGAAGDSQLSPTPWCFQHDVTALGGNKYSMFDDGGIGAGCLPGSTEHPARGLIITVNPSTTPAGVSLYESFSHSPSIDAGFTGSTQVLPNGDVLVDWGNTPEVTEYSSSGTVKMDLSMSSFSYRGFRFAWDGQPLTTPALAASLGNRTTSVWASWNGSTEVASWQFLGGSSAGQLSQVGAPVAKTGFETGAVLPAEYGFVEVEALNSSGKVLSVSAPVETEGYSLANSIGTVSAFGTAAASGSSTDGALKAPAVGIARDEAATGYWVVSSAGGIETFGAAGYHGSRVGAHLNAPIVDMAATPDGKGYWLAASDGGIFAYGTARYHGSHGGAHLNAPIVGMAATPDGKGYWLVASDGGVFTYGDAHFRGSHGGAHLNSPIVAIVPTPDGKGYWLIASDGGVFTYGDAHFRGSAVGSQLARPFVAAATTPDGLGYWLVGAGGVVASFGDAAFYGDGAKSPVVKVVGIAGG